MSASKIRRQGRLDISDEQEGPEDGMGDYSSTVPRVALQGLNRYCLAPRYYENCFTKSSFKL